jgi:hypothetical protein
MVELLVHFSLVPHSDKQRHWSTPLHFLASVLRLIVAMQDIFALPFTGKVANATRYLPPPTAIPTAGSFSSYTAVLKPVHTPRPAVAVADSAVTPAFLALENPGVKASRQRCQYLDLDETMLLYFSPTQFCAFNLVVDSTE